jgi:hypothetical protein
VSLAVLAAEGEHLVPDLEAEVVVVVEEEVNSEKVVAQNPHHVSGHPNATRYCVHVFYMKQRLEHS